MNPKKAITINFSRFCQNAVEKTEKALFLVIITTYGNTGFDHLIILPQVLNDCPKKPIMTE